MQDSGEQGPIGNDQLHLNRNPLGCCLPGDAFDEGVGHDLAPATLVP